MLPRGRLWQKCMASVDHGVPKAAGSPGMCLECVSFHRSKSTGEKE